MGENSAITWCDHTMNFWIGCAKVSAGCDNCYAETMMDKRYHRVQWGQRKMPGAVPSVGTRSLTSEANRRKPYTWQRKAAEFYQVHGRRQRVFCSSLSDVFDNQVPIEWLAGVLHTIRQTPSLDYLLLTKRPENILKQIHRAAEAIANGYSPPERVGHNSGGGSRGIGDRFGGEDLARQETHIQSVDGEGADYPMPSRSRGKRDTGRVSTDSGDDRREALPHGSASGGLLDR